MCVWIAFYPIDEPTRVTLQVRPQDVVANNDPEEAQYVYLHASSQSAAIQFDEGTPVLLSYKAGYTFIQTDKPIYTPNQEGKSDSCCLVTRQATPSYRLTGQSIHQIKKVSLICVA